MNALRTLVNIAFSLLLVATLVWGGCLSCSQYFMFANSSSGCCHPSGHCSKTPQVPASKECHIQPFAATKSFAAPDPQSLPAVAAPVVLMADQASVFNTRPLAFVPRQASPPDLCLLHSVFLI